jgi:hypothetical protein
MLMIAPRAVALVLFFAFAAAGCASGPADSGALDRETAHLKVVGLLYGRYMQAHGGAAPSDQDKFVAYIQREPENWNRLAPTAADLLTSPRDAQPLVILYGGAVEEPVDGGFPWIAHEKTGVAGRRLAVNARGNVELMTSQEIDQLFPSS